VYTFRILNSIGSAKKGLEAKVKAKQLQAEVQASVSRCLHDCKSGQWYNSHSTEEKNEASKNPQSISSFTWLPTWQTTLAVPHPHFLLRPRSHLLRLFFLIVLQEQ